MKEPQIKTMNLAELKAADYNPRQISAKALEGLKASIDRFGLVQPIIWNKRTKTVVGGHQRVKALLALGKKTALTIVVDEPLAEEKLMNLTLNNDAIQGEFTEDADDLRVQAMETDPSFYEATLMDAMDIPESAETNETSQTADAIPEPPKTPRTKRGEIWELGRHRIICDDSTSAVTLNRLMKREKADLVFTDPPYGVDYKAPGGKFKKIANDERKGDDLANRLLIPALRNAANNAKDTAAFYIWHASSTRDDFSYALKAAGIQERQYLIWAKPQIQLGWGDYNWSHEPCFYAAKAGKTPAFHADRTQSTIWRISMATEKERAATIEPGILIQDGQGGTLWVATKIPKGKKSRTLRILRGQSAILVGSAEAGDLWEISRDHGAQHPTQKPVALAEKAINNSTKQNELVLDVFLGSGTTLIGAETTGRRCFGVELDRGYCDVIISRWETLTGQKAKRIDSV